MKANMAWIKTCLALVLGCAGTPVLWGAEADEGPPAEEPIVDQVISSFTNVLISVVAARSLTPTGFGEFGVVFSAYLFALAFARTWTTEPFGILLARRDHAQRRSDAEGVCAVAVVIGFAGSVILMLASALSGMEMIRHVRENFKDVIEQYQLLI